MQLATRITQVSPSPTLSLDAKTKALAAQGVDIINLAAGEPDFDTPEHIKEAGIKAIRDNFTRYTASGGIAELLKAVCGKFLTDNGLEYTTDQVVISCGGKHTMYNLAQVLFAEGDEVIIPAPYWVSYPPIVTLAGATPVIVETREENGFRLTSEDLERQISPKTRALILNAPSNPTGAAYTREQLEALAEPVLKHKLIVISDDIYEKILFDGRTFANMAMLSPELKEQTIIAHGLAKTYAMTGWRIGYMAAPAAVAKAVGKLQSQSTSNPCSIAQKAAVAALTGPQDSVETMRQAFERRRAVIVDGLNAIPGVTCAAPGGSFYAFPNVSAHFGKKAGDKVMTGSSELADYLLEKARVSLVPGSAFGCDPCVRLSFATSTGNIREGLNRMAAALAELR